MHIFLALMIAGFFALAALILLLSWRALETLWAWIRGAGQFPRFRGISGRNNRKQ